MKNALLALVLSVFCVVLSSCGHAALKVAGQAVVMDIVVESVSPAVARSAEAFTNSFAYEDSAYAIAANTRCAFIDKLAIEVAEDEFICSDFLPYLSE